MSFNVYQPFLDYGLVPNPAVIFPTVIDNYEWGLFKDIAKDYYLCLKEFRAKEHKKSVWDSDQFQQELFDPSLFYTRAEVDKNLKEAGRKPQDFMSLLKSFICTRYYGYGGKLKNHLQSFKLQSSLLREDGLQR